MDQTAGKNPRHGSDSTIRIRRLPSGVRVITEPNSAVRSCGVGLWLDIGSRHEQPGEEGLSHFVEHMLFKGTHTKNVRQIGDAINYLGGNVNAYTTQEVLCVHARTVDRKAHEALDLLTEMITDSTFPAEELKRERQVVLEEYKMYEDSPEDLSVDTFLQNLWPSHPLGRPVIGTRGSIRKFSHPALEDYWRREFRPDRLLISIAGSFDAKACSQLLNKRLGSLVVPTTTAERPALSALDALPRQSYKRRPIEQSHFCLGIDGPDRRSPDRFAFGLMNMILGGGMSSRLFQEIREKRGLAYSIGSFAQLFSDHGFLAVSGGTSPATLAEVIRITLDEIRRICEEDVTEQELFLAREQVIDAMLMGMENTEARMTRLAESVLAYGRVVPLDEVIRRIRQVDATHVRKVAWNYFYSRPFAVSFVGPKEGQLPIKGKIGIK